MKNCIVLKITSHQKNYKILKAIIKKSLKDISFSKNNLFDINLSIKELFENAINHAYEDFCGEVSVEIHPFDYGVRIDVKDFGSPMSAVKFNSVSIIDGKNRGFHKIFETMDRFEFKNYGRKGKIFSIIKYTDNCFYPKLEKLNIKDGGERIELNIENLQIRDFHKSDEDWIAKMIYQNYGNSYIKNLFYYPQKILENANEQFYSIVAELEGKIIGHFSLIIEDDSNIAEIGVAVVSPKYKGLGIMNKMFDRLVEKADEIKLDAIYGEALMYHIFSQKANIKQGFTESCFAQGKIPKEITIENNPLSQKGKRGAALIGFKILKKQSKSIYIPTIYKDKIEQIYKNCQNITYTTLPNSNKSNPNSKSKLYCKFDPIFNIASIVIQKYGKNFDMKFYSIFSRLRIKHCDMIYADINLETIGQIDKVVKKLNNVGFYFCGVSFLKHHNQDYLHLQFKNSNEIGTKNFICHSEFCKELITFIKKDEKRVKKNN